MTISAPPEETAWSALVADSAGKAGVETATMMRRPALALGGKTLVVLARRHGPGIGARIGEADPAALGLTHWGPLQPFADKAPMGGWIVSHPDDAALWPDVLRTAIRFRTSEMADA